MPVLALGGESGNGTGKGIRELGKLLGEESIA
jgi:hypothetical protein